MDSIEVTGATVEEAIDAALQQLSSTRDHVEIEVLESPSRGLLGLVGGRAARVRVTRATPATPSAPPDSPPPSPEASLPRTTPAPSGTVEQRASDLLHGILERIGVDTAVTVRPHDEGILLEITGDASGLLIGRHGQMLDALEYIVNRALLRDDENAARVIIDSNDYRVRRRTLLEDLAHRMAEQAKLKGKPIVLDPMPPQDRRIIHLALQGDPSLTTKSSGTGVLRRLVIIPEGTTHSALDFE